MTVLFDHEIAVLRYNKETNAIELIWKQTQDEATYKLMFSKGLQAIHEYKATGWFSDIRHEGVVGPSAAQWVQHEIIPKAVAAGLSKIAVVMDADIFKEFYVNNIKNNAAGDMMQYFDSTAGANEWLQQPVVA